MNRKTIEHTEHFQMYSIVFLCLQRLFENINRCLLHDICIERIGLYNDEFGSAGMKPEDYSDIGEAKMLTREYGNELKFTTATDYLRYDGDCWREDKGYKEVATQEDFDKF